ncbi:MAG: Fructose-1,6-bisphosphatase/inositol-1-monophosphatase [Alphaproteobacteria bacterium MarineAlpha6_Bin2]|nr:MAG: Fructose-1,6-bisphosphatase/inositol-1-monophosphatase [Alphaproteobacteria bacterium MarineAlpha6_Bin2]
MSKIPQQLIKLANKCADASGKIIKKYFRKKIKINLKKDNTPFTKADIEAEKIIRELILKQEPNCGFVGEETGSINMNREYCWVVDPLDGTKSFITGKPSFGTLIGLLKNNKPVLGILNQPILNERWVGIAGVETKYNNKKVRVRKCKSIKGAKMYATSPMMFQGRNKKIYKNVRAKIGECLFGADCYSHGLMSLGFVDVILEANLKPWDYIASASIISGAGGKITDWNDNDLNLQSDGRILATGDSNIHKQIIKIIQK